MSLKTGWILALTQGGVCELQADAVNTPNLDSEAMRALLHLWTTSGMMHIPRSYPNSFPHSQHSSKIIGPQVKKWSILKEDLFIAEILHSYVVKTPKDAVRRNRIYIKEVAIP